MSVCNIYKKLFGDDGKQNTFYCFSEYSDALAGVITDDEHVKVTPSKYVLLNLDNTEVLGNYLQNKYDNLTCVIRDDKKDNARSYLSTYLGTLIYIMRDTDIWTDDTTVCSGDIDIISTNTIDGCNYTEWMVSVGPTDKRNYELMYVTRKERLTDTETYIRGYASEASRASGIAEYGYESYVNSTDLYTYKMDQVTPPDETEFEFNCVLILMDMEIGGVTYPNIPMGIYVMPDTVTKKISDSTIYGQGTSWGLKVAMRFANTVDGNNSISIEEDDQCHFLACIDRLNDTIDTMNAMTKKFNDFYNYARSLVWEGQSVQAEPKTWVEFTNRL